MAITKSTEPRWMVIRIMVKVVTMAKARVETLTTVKGQSKCATTSSLSTDEERKVVRRILIKRRRRSKRGRNFGT